MNRIIQIKRMFDVYRNKRIVHKKRMKELTTIIDNMTDDNFNILKNTLLELYNKNNDKNNVSDVDIEKELDSNCYTYKFNKYKPCENIYYNENKRNYTLNCTYTKNKRNITRKKLSTLVNINKDIQTKYYNNLIHKIVMFKKIKYKSNEIIIYIKEIQQIEQNELLLDYNHIKELFKINNEINESDKLYDFRDNEYGGYYVKEFITQKTFIDLLQNNNINNEDINYIKNLLHSVNKSNNNYIYKNNHKNDYCYNYFNTYDNENRTYENTELVNFIKDKIFECKNKIWINYVNKHVMYLYIMTLNNPDNRILCKIGYSYNFISRLKQLRSEYNANFYLLGLKLINSEHDEKEFHSYLKTLKPELHYKITINKKIKDEIYIFDKILYAEFMSYCDKIQLSHDEIKLTNETINELNNYFNNIDNKFNNDIKNLIK